MLKENNVRKGFFEHDQLIALRNALPDDLKTLVTFGYKVGWRDKEITKLPWNNVDLQNGIVTLEIGETKNDDARTVYLDEELKEIFQNQWKNRKHKVTPFVFPNTEDTGRIVNFRRTAVRNMVRSGKSLLHKGRKPILKHRWAQFRHSDLAFLPGKNLINL